MTSSRRFGRFDPARSMQEHVSSYQIDPSLEPVTPGMPSRATLAHALLVFVGGSIGTLLRYLVVVHVHEGSHSFPWAVFAINVSGAFLLGILGGTLFERRPDAVGARIFLAAGILGGWTTYSSVVAGMLTFAHDQAWGTDGFVLVCALIVPILTAGLGILLGTAALRRWTR